MRVAGQPVATEHLEIVELLAHALAAAARMPAAAHEELADNLGATVPLLVEKDFAVLHAEDAELGRTVANSHLRQDVLHQIGVKRIARGKMSKVLFWHRHALKRSRLPRQHRIGKEIRPCGSGPPLTGQSSNCNI